MSDLSGGDLRQAFVAATQSLERYRDAINALNVFPVPDGDTGTNMLLTIRSALEQCPGDEATAAQVSSGLAEGAFWGARGNSGVILSQLFRGLADALREAETCSGRDLARGLTLAADAAYGSVAQPVEGTMLTVLRSTSTSVQRALEGEETPEPRRLWEQAFRSSVEAVYQTPSQMAMLREAGVVDAGGMGVAVIMGGALCQLTASEQAVLDEAVAAACTEPVVNTGGGGTGSNIDPDFLDSTLEAQWGYCIQFLIEGQIEGQGLALEDIRKHFGTEWSDSAVVVGDQRLARVHLHSEDPGSALSYGASLGDLHEIKIENMGRQNREFVQKGRGGQAAPAGLAVVAVVQGQGLAQLFKDTGCSMVINGGQTMNPSVGQFLEAAQATGAAEIIVLPNNSNVEATALQSAGADTRISVVPARTVPQGVSALLAFNPEEPLERNLKSMTDALDGVSTLEVTQAVRSTSIEGAKVEAGQYIALLEGDLAGTAESPEDALKTALDGVVQSADQIVTLYRGEDASEAEAEELCRYLEAKAPGLQVELVYGGQPHYHYLASVE